MSWPYFNRRNLTLAFCLNVLLAALFLLSFLSGWVAVYLGLSEFGLHKYASIVLLVAIVIHIALHHRSLKRRRRIPLKKVIPLIKPILKKPMTRLLAVAIGVFAVAAVSGISFSTVSQAGGPTPNPGCTPNVVPVGQANPPGSQLEPLAPIWCFTPLNAPNPPGRVTGANDWVDTFAGVAQTGRFNDGDYDYRVFEHVENPATAFQSMHFTNNGHWMDDNAGGAQGGAMIRPNRSFTAENGKLVIEQDVAAGISGYGGNAWAEIDISQGAQPATTTGGIVDTLYGYGQFGGNWTFGCRLHNAGNPICALENAASNVTNTDNSPASCFASAPARIMEISDFEVCGTTHFGGDRGGNNNANYFRQCTASNEPDMLCRDRFRIELTSNSMTMYVNGHLYFQDSGWPVARQIPASVLNGQWFVYATDWQSNPQAPAYRFHWQRFAVNPHDSAGNPVGPSAAPSFCLGQPGNTCMAGMATNTPVPVATATNTPVPAVTATSTATATATATNTPAPQTCTVQAKLNGVDTTYTRPASVCTNQ